MSAQYLATPLTAGTAQGSANVLDVQRGAANFDLSFDFWRSGEAEPLWKVADGREPEPVRHHPDDGVRRPVERNRAGQDAGIRRESPPPETLGDHHDTHPRDVFVDERAAVICLDPQRVEEMASHANRSQALGLVDAGQIQSVGPDPREAVERAAAPDEIVDIARRPGQPIEPGALLDLRAVAPHHCQPIRLGKRQRADESGIDNTEDRDVGSDAQGERDDGDEREARALTERADGDAEVSHWENVGVSRRDRSIRFALAPRYRILWELAP